MNESTRPNRSQPGPATRTLWRVTRRILVVLMALAALHGIVTVILGRRYEAELDRIRARREPVAMTDLAEFVSGPISHSENAAVIYRKAYKMLEEKTVNPEAETLFRILSPEDWKKVPTLWSDAEKAAPKLSGIMRLMEEADAKPGFYVPIRWQDGAAIELNHYAQLRQLARVPACLAILDARRGDVGAAIRHIELGIRLSDRIKRDPIAIGFLVRIALMRFGTTAAQDLIEQCALTDPQARRLFDAFGSIDLDPQFGAMWLGERAYIVWGFDYARKHGLTDVIPEENVGNALVTRLPGYLLRPLLYADASCALRLYAGQISTAGVPYRLLKLRGLDSEEQAKSLPSYAYLTRAIAPALSRMRLAYDKCQAEINATRAALAVIAYKDHLGSYPGSLTDVTNKLGWDLPEDPFSGKEPVYKRQRTGFIVYSVGPNLKDDGGRAAGPGKNIDDDGDILVSRNL